MTEEFITPENPEKKIYKGRLYKVRSVFFTALIGGPLASAYIISHNFRVLGDKKKAQWTWLFLVIFVVLIVLCDTISPGVPGPVFGLISLLISVNVMNRYQEKEIINYIESGNIPFSNWRGFFIGVISLVIVFLVVAGLMSLSYYLES